MIYHNMTISLIIKVVMSYVIKYNRHYVNHSRNHSLITGRNEIPGPHGQGIQYGGVVIIAPTENIRLSYF